MNQDTQQAKQAFVQKVYDIIEAYLEANRLKVGILQLLPQFPYHHIQLLEIPVEQIFHPLGIQLGEMLLAQGIAVTAFKESLSKLDGPPAIAAGLALIAIGSAMRSGIQALANRGGGSTATASVGDAGGSAATSYMTELTIHVEGRLDGGDIVLSGKKTTDAWGR